MYLHQIVFLLVNGKYENINNLKIIFSQLKFSIIFFRRHNFDPSEYFAIDSNYLLKCREIFPIYGSNYMLHLT